MTRCAHNVMTEFTEMVLAYGQSDEYSFVFKKETQAYKRRESKLMTNVASLFASSYVFHWPEFFPNVKLLYPPSFDGRVVIYPSDQNLRDYLSWRQADCHINNLYNTAFWALVQEGGLSNKEAQTRLSGTFSSNKNEILFSEFGINYNQEPEILKKGTILLRKEIAEEVTITDHKTKEPKSVTKVRKKIEAVNCDLIGDTFWVEHPYLLNTVGTC
ncbi:PREDICTED: probable tRNA(His) guanylyltransferase isoform X2 [Priapulus caudatus]|nr:PREDICTED: probable tRNA(His) guanylyltransferase isoform X2 [Priapulus caudatus]